MPGAPRDDLTVLECWSVGARGRKSDDLHIVAHVHFAGCHELHQCGARLVAQIDAAAIDQGDVARDAHAALIAAERREPEQILEATPRQL